MKQAVRNIREALATKDVVPHMTHYLVRGGMVHASDGHVTAAAPFDYDGTFLVPGIEFERLLDRLPDDATIQELEGAIRIKAGRLRGTIQTLDPADVHYAAPPDTWIPVPEDFMTGLILLRPFISDNALHAWSICVYAERDFLYATNNVVLARVPVASLGAPGVLLPVYVVDFLLRRGIEDYPTHYMLTEHMCAFRWPDFSWMSASLYEGRMPEVAVDMLAQHPATSDEIKGDAWVEVEGEWREALETLTDMSEGDIRLYADRMVGGRGMATYEYEMGSPVPDERDHSAWNIAKIKPMVTAATHWDPTRWPKPAPFVGDGIMGVIAGAV